MRSSRLISLFVALLGAPAFVLAQGQIDAGRANDASNRYGSGGRNASYTGVNTYSNQRINTGNQIVTGNVTMGREFRDRAATVDPSSFRGNTAGTMSDNFIKNSSGVPRSYASEPVPNVSTPFYGQSQTVAPPPGTILMPNRGYVPPTATPAYRPAGDQRLGIVDLNQQVAPLPLNNQFITAGNLSPNNAQTIGVLTASSLYGVREWNPQDAADRAALEGLLRRQNMSIGRLNLDAQTLDRMRTELQKALGDEVPAGARIKDQVRQIPITGPIGNLGNPELNRNLLNDQLEARMITGGLDTEQAGMRIRLLDRAHRTSTKYSELNERLKKYYGDHNTTELDLARQFNAELRAREAAKVAKSKTPGTGTDTGNKVKPEDTPKPPVEDPTKPKVKKPTPLKVVTLSEGIKTENLANMLKQAEGLMKEGKFSSAMDQYDAAEAVAPNNPMIWLGRANAELGAGFYSRAEAHLRQAFMADKSLLLGQYDITAMMGEERLQKTVADLKELANKDNAKPLPVFLLAYIAYNTNHERQALGYLDLAEKRAGAKDPFFWTVRKHWNLPEDGAKPQDNK